MSWGWAGVGAFFIPAAIALAGALFLWIALRDTPRSVGLPEWTEAAGEPDAGKESGRDFRRFVRKQVFGNPYLWILGLANFFVYSVRYAVLDWGPTLLEEWKGIP